MHEVTNVGSDRSQLAHMAKETKATLDVENLDVVADRGYFNGEERFWQCEEAGITVTLPKADDLELKGRRTLWQAGTSATSRKRMFMYVLPANGSPTPT